MFTGTDTDTLSAAELSEQLIDIKDKLKLQKIEFEQLDAQYQTALLKAEQRSTKMMGGYSNSLGSGGSTIKSKTLPAGFNDKYKPLVNQRKKAYSALSKSELALYDIKKKIVEQISEQAATQYLQTAKILMQLHGLLGAVNKHQRQNNSQWQNLNIPICIGVGDLHKRSGQPSNSYSLSTKHSVGIAIDTELEKLTKILE